MAAASWHLSVYESSPVLGSCTFPPSRACVRIMCTRGIKRLLMLSWRAGSVSQGMYSVCMGMGMGASAGCTDSAGGVVNHCKVALSSSKY
jgi:hypothetical protein